jgi:nucleotide-binding universal stress UspA family protein
LTSPIQPVLLCYDRSPAAQRAIERAGVLMSGVPALVLHVWASVGPDALRHLPKEVGEVADIVVEELDSSSVRRAEEVVAEGAALADSVGLAAEPMLAEVPAPLVGHPERHLWEGIVRVAHERDVAAVVIGSRGLSRLGMSVLGSVSYGVVHHCTRPVLIVPSADSEAA